MNRRFFLFLLAVTISPLAGFAKSDEQAVRTADLSKQQSSWITVSGGTVVAPPVATDYGFAVYNDGRMLCALTNDGKLLWQKAVTGRQSPYVAAFGDFLYVVSATNRLNLVNPSGLTLWTANIGFDVVETPLSGRDGRVFVRGKTALACYGLNGLRKWILITGNAASIPLLTFSDGSLLALSDQLKEGKSTGIRVSPFGDILETITFSGKIIAARETPSGILISQEDKTIGLCAVQDGTVQSVWMAASSAKKPFPQLCPSDDGETAAFVTQAGKQAEVSMVQTKTGTEEARFPIGDFTVAETTLFTATETGFVIADDRHARGFLPDGTVIWEATLPQRKRWDHLYYTPTNALVVCGKDWSIKGYVMEQSVAKKIKKTTPPPSSYLQKQTVRGMTASSMNLERLSMEQLKTIATAFDNGDYGKQEEAWLNSIKRESQTFIADYSALLQSSHDGLSYFTANPVYTQSLITIMAKTGTTGFAEDFADILAAETDKARLALTIQQAGKEAYDKDGALLSALETVLTYKLTPRDQNILKLVCDATYDICRFMGKPALNKKGKNILAYLFYPQFDKGTRDYARQTLARIMDLEL